LEVRLFKRLLLRGTRISEFIERVFEKHTDSSEKQKISLITEDPAALLSLMMRPSRKNLQRVLTENGIVLSSEQVRGILAEVKEFKGALRTINPIYFLTGSDKNVFRVLRKIIKALTVSAAKRIKLVPSSFPVSTESPDQLTEYLKKLGVKENSLEQARTAFDIRSKIGALHKKAVEEDDMAFVYITGDSKVGKTTFTNFAKEGLSAALSNIEFLSMDEVYDKYGDEFSSGEGIRDYLFRRAKNQRKKLVVVEGVNCHLLARTGDLNFIIQLRANYATRLENILREEASLDLLWSKSDVVKEAIQVDLSRGTRPYRAHIRSIFALTDREVEKLSSSFSRSEMREEDETAELLRKGDYRAVTDRLILLDDRQETESLRKAIDTIIRLSSDENLKPCCVNHDHLNTLVEACRVRLSIKLLTAERVAAYLVAPEMGEMLKSVTSELVQKLIALDMASKESGERSFYASLIDLVPQEKLVESLKDWFRVFVEYRAHDFFWHETLSSADRVLSPEKGIVLRAFSKNHYFLFEGQRPMGFVFAMASRQDREAHVFINISDEKDVRHGLGRAIMQWIAGEIASRRPGKEAFVTLYEPATDSSAAFMKKCLKEGIFSRLEIVHAQAENSRSLSSPIQWIPFQSEASTLPPVQGDGAFFIRGIVQPRLDSVPGESALRSEMRVAVDTAEGVFRQSKVLAMGKTALNGMLASLMPQAYAMTVQGIDYGPMFAALDTGYGTPVSVVFEKIPALSEPITQALAQFLAANRFIKFYVVVPGAGAQEVLKFKKDLEALILQKAKKAVSVHVVSDAALIPDLISKNAFDRALIYDIRAEGASSLQALEAGLKERKILDSTMRVYDLSEGAQKPAAFFATLHEFFNLKKVSPQIRSALEILSHSLGIQAMAQKLIEQAA
jgi:hypothetical protein